VASRLLRGSVRRNDAGCEERSLSLGHDALTRVTAPWKQEIERRAERRRWRTVAGLATLVGFLSLACAGLWVAVVMREHARQAEKARAVDKALLAARQQEKGGDLRVAMRELAAAKAKLDPADDVLLRRLDPELRSYSERLGASESYTREVGRHVEEGYKLHGAARYDEAITDCGEALKLDPKNANAHNVRGLAWYGKREYDKAIADYGDALKLDPKNAQFYSNRGLAWYGKREYDKAIADCGEALELDPKNAYALINRGVARYGKGEYDKAIADYGEALKLDRDSFAVHKNIAWIRATCPDPKYRDRSQAARTSGWL